MGEGEVSVSAARLSVFDARSHQDKFGAARAKSDQASMLGAIRCCFPSSIIRGKVGADDTSLGRGQRQKPSGMTSARPRGAWGVFDGERLVWPLHTMDKIKAESDRERSAWPQRGQLPSKLGAIRGEVSADAMRLG